MEKQESGFDRLLNEFKPQTYESEFTKFVRELKQQRPHLEAEQRRSRAIWWDHTPDLDTQEREEQSRVKQQAYVYQTKV